MRRLRNSVKAIIATVCVVAVLVGVIVGIIVYNNNKKPGTPPPTVGFTPAQQQFANAVNEYAKHDKPTYEILDNSVKESGNVCFVNVLISLSVEGRKFA